MEQRLIEDLVIESIKIYGIDVCYIPRTIVKEDFLFGEDVLSEFNHHYMIEMYIKNVDGFGGDGDFLSKFGLEIRDQMVLTVSQRRFHEEIGSDQTTTTNETPGIDRPSEGDLIYFPLNNKLFEVKFVEHEAIFYQMGSLQTYDLTLELFEYSHEQINTGSTIIDGIETSYSGDMNFYKVTDENGDALLAEDGSFIIDENYRIEDTDSTANNEYYAVQTRDGSDANFIDWSESNPFGDF
jgi:hypothetical protein